MWNDTIRRHCSDELLLAHIDGELSARHRNAAVRHLHACWECRARLTELEEAAETLARAARSRAFPGPDQIEEAKQRFRLRQQEFDLSVDEKPHWALRAFPWRPVAVVSTLLVAAAVSLWIGTHPRPAGEKILGQAQQAEAIADPGKPLVHQVLDVEIAQTLPAGQQRRGTLEVWADTGGHRFASRWRDAGGTLRQGIWRHSGSEDYVFNATHAPGKSVEPAIAHLAQVSGRDLESLEMALLAWLAGRRWEPVSLTREFQTFRSGADSLTLEEFNSPQAGPCLRLLARRQTPAWTVEFTLEVDARTFRPLAEKVRVQSAERTLEVRLVVQKAEAWRADMVAPAVFVPDIAVVAPDRPLRAEKPRRPVLERIPAPAPQMYSGDELEIDTLYALHRIRACAGESVETVRQPSGEVLVRGLVETDARKQQVLAALGEFQGLRGIRLDIRTVFEAGSTRSRQTGTKAVSDATSQSATRVRGQRSSIEDQLAVYLARGAAPGSADARLDAIGVRVARFSDEIVQRVESIRTEAWALHQLAERFPADRIGRLTAHSRWLLELMVNQHVRALQTQAHGSRDLLDPVLEAIAPNEMRLQDRQRPPRGDTNWSSGCVAVVETVKRITALTDGLFGGAQLRENPREASAALAAGLRQLQSTIQDFEKHSAKVFGRDWGRE